MPLTTPREYWYLTRDQFIKELDEELALERERRINKYDHGAAKYGEEVNLFTRDFDAEALDEDDDKANYKLFGRVLKRRKEELPK